jgi:hypothetical protein
LIFTKGQNTMLDSQSINLLNVAPAVKAAFHRLLGVDVGAPGSVNGPGIAFGATVAAAEYGVGPLRKTVLTCSRTPISIADDAAVAQYGGVQVYDFPPGLLLFLGAVIDGALTGYASLIDTFDGDMALGTITATTGATLVSTEADLMQSVALSQAVAEVAVADAVTVAAALTESGARHLDGTGTAKDMFLNFVIDDNAAHGAGTAFFTGTISFAWMILGDK